MKKIISAMHVREFSILTTELIVVAQNLFSNLNKKLFHREEKL